MTTEQLAPHPQHGLPIPVDNAHTHLSALKSGGVTDAGYISLCATGPGNWEEVAQAASASSGRIIPSFGLHPWKIDGNTPFDSNAMIPWLEQYPAAGIGEIGLDKSRHSHAPIDEQKSILRSQIKLALAYDRVITLHCVRAWGGLLETLAQTAPRRILIHGWSGDESLLRPFVELGAFFSLGRRSLASIDTAAFLRGVPASRLLLETDDETSGLDELFNELHRLSEGGITRKMLHDNFTRLFLP